MHDPKWSMSARVGQRWSRPELRQPNLKGKSTEAAWNSGHPIWRDEQHIMDRQHRKSSSTSERPIALEVLVMELKTQPQLLKHRKFDPRTPAQLQMT
ncbi:hypothetical protein [Oryza sativa Japonica Group]|uniref:Uncharacterized protein n=1 Tax=Oryza sativa subsp. japonica TaxID=39947 RepID=Q5JLI0_ORYSJ|nr:hypothetical protein [Oryza sativa Japonica Group]